MIQSPFWKIEIYKIQIVTFPKKGCGTPDRHPEHKTIPRTPPPPSPRPFPPRGNIF